MKDGRKEVPVRKRGRGGGGRGTRRWVVLRGRASERTSEWTRDRASKLGVRIRIGEDKRWEERRNGKSLREGGVGRRGVMLRGRARERNTSGRERSNERGVRAEAKE